jgi:hypothetical protein
MYKLSQKKIVNPNGREAKMLPKNNKWQQKKLNKLHKKNQQTRK